MANCFLPTAILMMAQSKKHFSYLRMLEGQPIHVLNTFSKTYVTLFAGDAITFSTSLFKDARGVVLEIDHGAEYPIKVEWFTNGGDKRIASFHPDEFVTIIKEMYAQI